MKLSLNWLNKFVDISDIAAEDVMDKLTLHTAEIEELQPVGVEFDKVAVGLITERKSIEPGYALLSLDIGKASQVVCTDETLQVGDFVAVGLSGATIEGNLIEDKEIKGQKSSGMLLCERELLISAYDETVLRLNKDNVDAERLKPGTPILQAMPFLRDTLLILDNKSVTHRPDLWGIYGFARELSAIYQRPLKELAIVSQSALKASAAKAPKVTVHNQDACKRYAAVFIENVDNRKAPLEMQTLLYRSEVNPYNLTTDLTNYVMLELGQPMHAFDNDTLKGEIIVDKNKGALNYEFLDGETRTLLDGSLFIYDGAKNPVAVAGIMGGEASKIANSTQTVLLESANFDAKTIRMTSGAIKLRTDASVRFEKSLAAATAVLAVQRYLYLLSANNSNIKFSQLADINSVEEMDRRIELPHSFVDSLMGKSLSAEKISGILSALGFENSYADAIFQVKTPWFRTSKDIANKADLVEEIARIFGYNNIEPKPPMVQIEPTHKNAPFETERTLKQILSFQFGFNEVKTYPWEDERWIKKLDFKPDNIVSLVSPGSIFSKTLKTTLMPALLQLAEKNMLARERFQIYEYASVYNKTGVKEKKLLSGLIFEKKGDQDALFRSAKQYVEYIFKRLLNRQPFFEMCEDAAKPWMGQAIRILYAEQEFGYIALLSPRLKKALFNNNAVVVFEFHADAFAGLRAAPLTFNEPLPFPTASLDFNILADQAKTYNEIDQTLRSFQHKHLIDLTFIEIFQDEKALPGKKSFLYAMTIGSSEGTLEGKQISAFQETFIKHLHANKLELR